MYNCPPKRYNMKTPQKYHPSLFSPAVASVPLLPSLSSYRLTNFVYFQHTSDRCLWEGRLSFNAYIWRNLIWTAFCFITISHHCSQENHSSWCGKDCQSTYRFNYRDFENCILPLNPSKRTWEPGEVIYAFCKVCNAQLHSLCGGRDRKREMWNKDNDEAVIKRARVMQCNLYLIVQSRLAPLAADSPPHLQQQVRWWNWLVMCKWYRLAPLASLSSSRDFVLIVHAEFLAFTTRAM